MNHGLWPLGPIAQFHLITLIFYLKNSYNRFTLFTVTRYKFIYIRTQVSTAHAESNWWECPNVHTRIMRCGGPIIIHGAGDGVFVFHKLQKFKSPKGGEIH